MSDLTQSTKPTTKLNPTIAPAYRNDKFGYGSLLSKELNEESIQIIGKNLQVGSKLLVKKGKTQTKNGDDQYFIEILPPYDGPKKGATRVQVSDDSGI